MCVILYASGMKQARETALECNEYGDGFEPFQSGQAAALAKIRHSLFCACVCVCVCARAPTRVYLFL